MSIKIDHFDLIILRELLLNGCKTFTQIANEHNTTKEIIANHFKKMTKKGVIVGSSIRNSVICYGCNFIVLIFIKSQPQKLIQICEYVSKIPGISVAYPYRVKRTCFAAAVLKNIGS